MLLKFALAESILSLALPVCKVVFSMPLLWSFWFFQASWVPPGENKEVFLMSREARSPPILRSFGLVSVVRGVFDKPLWSVRDLFYT